MVRFYSKYRSSTVDRSREFVLDGMMSYFVAQKENGKIERWELFATDTTEQDTH